MGMTIDEAVTWLNTDDYESKGFADATIVAIDTMRKYQKIEQIIEVWRQDIFAKDFECIAEVAEVVEDES